MKKLFVLLTIALSLLLAGCQKGEEKIVVGICQIAKHEALDAATNGFMDALKEEFGDKIEFDLQIAGGDMEKCATICNGFAASNVNLILANATASLQAASAATEKIPVLGTAITEYGVALDIDNFNGLVGGNVSGTSDLAPLDQQAAMFTELLPEAKTIGILYCSSEANSLYQYNVVRECLEKAGFTVNKYTFSDSNNVSLITEQACQECDALYIPTDNTAASCSEAIGQISARMMTPIIAGEESLCKNCGIATLSIDYYNLGFVTGQMAVKILKGESKIEEMPIQYFENPVFKFNKEFTDLFGINVPEHYVAMGE